MENIIFHMINLRYSSPDFDKIKEKKCSELGKENVVCSPSYSVNRFS